MTSRIPKLRQPRGLLLLGVCLLLLGLLPAQSTLAAFKNLPIDNTLAEFARGQFQRASLGAVRLQSIPNQKIADENGAVQLGPIGLLRNWKKLPSTLPSKLANMGTAAIGSRMFVIGGIDSLSNYLDSVYSAGIDTTNGQILSPGWQAEPALAAVHGSDNLSPGALVSAIASPAVAAVSKPGGGGYLYVIGGEIPQGTRKFSSYAVQRASVGTDGRIAAPGWADLGVTGQIPLPDPNNVFNHRGVLGASAVVFKTPNGKTYIYLIGGLEQYLNGSIVEQRGTRRVWYTEVNVSNGALSNPTGTGTSVWARLDDIPLPGTLPVNGGLWNTTAVADHFLTTVNGTNDALYVIGGLNIPATSTASQEVYRALINPSTGALTWTPKASDSTYYTLPESRAGHGAAIFRGNIYLTSGQASNSTNPDTSVLTTYIEDDLDLHNFGVLGAGSDFLASPGALDCNAGNPCTPRTTHGTILVQAGPTAPNTAFLYIIGGRGLTTDPVDGQGSDSIEMAKIGGDEDVKITGYAPTGIFYSATYPIVFDLAQIQQISWATQITRTTGVELDDIALDYRISNDSDCTRPSWTDASWQSVDGAPTDTHTSINGQNTVDLTSIAARCFQYRVTMTSSADLKQTPSLLNVSIRIFVPGNPDLSVKSITDRRGAKNLFTGLNVLIQNVNQLSPPTLAADVEGGGSFYVDMCIYGPNASGAAPTLPLTPANKQCSKAFANVNKSLLGPNAVYPVTQWYDTATEQPAELISFFQQPGTYTVYVAVDSYVDDAAVHPKGFIDEGDQGEGNNVSAAFTFTVDEVGYGSFLPQVRR
jgi:hypothetical protein